MIVGLFFQFDCLSFPSTRYLADPVATKKALRLELELDLRLAAEVFVLVVLVTDGYLRLREEVGGVVGEAAARFLSLAMKLPMELQMVLCHRMCGLAKDHVAVSETERVLRNLVWKI